MERFKDLPFLLFFRPCALPQTTKWTEPVWGSQGHSGGKENQDPVSLLVAHPDIRQSAHPFHSFFLWNPSRIIIPSRGAEATCNSWTPRPGQQHPPSRTPVSSIPLMCQDNFSSWYWHHPGTSPLHHCTVSSNPMLSKEEFLAPFTSTFTAKVVISCSCLLESC